MQILLRGELPLESTFRQALIDLAALIPSEQLEAISHAIGDLIIACNYQGINCKLET